MSDIEIEIQVNIEKSKPLLDFLREKGEFVSEKRQIDEYFVPAHRDFTTVRPLKEWLRLRKEKSGSSITYKHWYHDKSGKSTHCDEFETNIENLEPLKKIFMALDFKSLIKVEKQRKVWLLKEWEISMDSVKGLGDFVEIEYKGKGKVTNPKKITNEMVAFLKDLGCGEIKRNYQGYPFLLLFPEEAEHEIL